MKKPANKPVMLFSLFIFLSSFAFSQAFDDLPYSNPDRPTYFQQEMTSLMKFQAANDINVPFFVSLSGRSRSATYNKDYIRSLSGIDDLKHGDWVNGSMLNHWFENEYLQRLQEDNPLNDGISDMQILLGAQIRINSYLYIPVLFNVGNWQVHKILGAGPIKSNSYTYEYGYVTISSSIKYRDPLEAQESNTDLFLGSGLFINTKWLQGGIYAGYSFTNQSAQDAASGFKIALLPMVKTKDWKTIGWLLDSVLGYFGLGNAVTLMEEEKGNTTFSGLANALNIGLDLAFTRAHWGPFTLDAQAIYNRGNYDAAAKVDTYGGKLTGLFPNNHFGFTLEGGWKNFFYVSTLYADEYRDTGYFSGSIFFPFKYLTFGLTYQYDGVTHHQFGVALTTNFLSGFVSLSPRAADEKYEQGIGGSNVGARFRWGGWKANKKKAEGGEANDQ
jgi:hypothetical protein